MAAAPTVGAVAAAPTVGAVAAAPTVGAVAACLVYCVSRILFSVSLAVDVRCATYSVRNTNSPIHKNVNNIFTNPK